VKKEVNAGIDLVKTFKFHITDDSTEAIKEVEQYKWAEDKNGEPIDKPVDYLNHAQDCKRYAITSQFFGRNIEPRMRVIA
jgi:phage terminase large subunit